MHGEKLLQALRELPTNPDHYRKQEFAFSTGAQGVRTEVASLEAQRLVALRGEKSFDLAPTAIETFTTDGSAGDTETFNFSHSLYDSKATAEAVVLYENGTRVQPDSVSFANDSFDYTDDGTNNDLTAFYTSDTQAAVEVQKVAPNGVTEGVFSGNIGSIHRREVDKRPLTLDVGLSPLHPVVPTDYRIEVYIDAPYTAAFQYDNGHGTVRATNALLDVPIRGASGDGPDGVGAAVRHDMADR